MKLPNSAMTIRELIDALQDELENGIVNEDTKVLFTYEYGDRARTIAAIQVEELIPGYVKYSTYLNSFAEATDPDDDNISVLLIH